MNDTNALFDPKDVILFAFLILFAFVVLFIVFLFGSWARRNAVSISPYSGLPLRRASELPYQSAREVLKFLYERGEYDNRIFDLKKATFCRETGRIFPDSITWLDTINVDWSFLRKRYSGDLVSWGSLTEDQKLMIQDAHDSLKGFQTEVSSSNPLPKDIEAKYALLKPGPLYVDINTKFLVGWQEVPDTHFEVLIIQKPKELESWQKRY